MYSPFRSILPSIAAVVFALCVSTTLIASATSMPLTPMSATAYLA